MYKGGYKEIMYVVAGALLTSSIAVYKNKKVDPYLEELE